MEPHPIAATWGRDDLASSDMMSMETSKRVWQARLDPRRQTPSVGIYTHVRDRWGIFYVQPIVLNERQAGAAIEGVVRQEHIEITQWAVDTHGYTDFAMMLARLLATGTLDSPWPQGDAGDGSATRRTRCPGARTRNSACARDHRTHSGAFTRPPV